MAKDKNPAVMPEKKKLKRAMFKGLYEKIIRKIYFMACRFSK